MLRQRACFLILAVFMYYLISASTGRRKVVKEVLITPVKVMIMFSLKGGEQEGEVREGV